jgi:Ca2+-binding EF-hand superfamily protein
MKKRSQTRKFSISEIENLFINKFLEKYQLTERDIQRAFKKYDMDGSGKLSLHELGGKHESSAHQQSVNCK